MKNKALLLSIKPRFADGIFSGTKRYELRRVKPKIKQGDFVWVYVTSPRSQIEGVFEISDVHELPLEALWKKVSKTCALTKTEFMHYFVGKEMGCALAIHRSWKIDHPIKLGWLKAEQILPPQGHRYLNQTEVDLLVNQGSPVAPKSRLASG